jgi:hypothetical protein
MKVKNWKRKIGATLVAAGLWFPHAATAANIPLADPSFETYTIATNIAAGSQYAYAPAYRPTSAWVDDQDSPGSAYVQDNKDSNWLYTSAYGEKPTNETPANKRGTPRNGNQAMHGFFKYSTQEVAAVFEAGKTYTFSLYAQGDIRASIDTSGADSAVFLYLFNGNQPFSEANSVATHAYKYTTGDFLLRTASDTQADSLAKWRQVSLSLTVPNGAPYIGAPIGVGFYLGSRVAVDDASLAVVPEPGTLMLVSIAGVSLLALARRKSV